MWGYRIVVATTVAVVLLSIDTPQALADATQQPSSELPVVEGEMLGDDAVGISEVDAGLQYQMNRRSATPSFSLPDATNDDDAITVAGNGEQYHRSGGGHVTEEDTVESEPLNLPCSLINDAISRREQHLYPVDLSYIVVRDSMVKLLNALVEQYTGEHHYVCPPEKMQELRKMLDSLGELRSLFTRRDQLRILGGNSFGTLGPHCASHLIIASDALQAWAIAAETLFNGLATSEKHCTTGWANFLAFLSNAPALVEPQLQSPECMRRPSYAKCFNI